MKSVTDLLDEYTGLTPLTAVVMMLARGGAVW